MLILADSELTAQQSLVTGRLFEQFTERAFEGYDIALRLSRGGAEVTLPARLQRKPGGYFALGIAPGRDMPELPGSGNVSITLTVSIPGRAPFERSRSVTAAAVALVARSVEVQGQALPMTVVQDAPFGFTIELPPAPVALAGTVIDDNDPSEPVAGAVVSVAPAPSVTTDGGGRFFIPALPVEELLEIQVAGDGAITEHDFRPDYSKPVNTVTLSV